MNAKETVKAYTRDLQPRYKALAKTVRDIAEVLLRAKGVTPASVTYRAKSPESLSEKISRQGKDYENPLQDITDLAGVRIVTYLPDEVDSVAEALAAEFRVDEGNSIDKRAQQDPGHFGYASVHLVVQLSKARARLSEYAELAGLKCEIQVRTILQHAWAEMEHKTVYKSTEQIPAALRRKFASLAGLLEVADREFQQLVQQEESVRDGIIKAIYRHDLDVPIDLESVTAYLRKHHSENYPAFESVGRLVRALNQAGITKIKAFHEILTPEVLVKADRTVFACPRRACTNLGPQCLLRYFIALGEHAGRHHREIAAIAECKALKKLWHCGDDSAHSVGSSGNKKRRRRKPAADDGNALIRELRVALDKAALSAGVDSPALIIEATVTTDDEKAVHVTSKTALSRGAAKRLVKAFNAIGDYKLIVHE